MTGARARTASDAHLRKWKSEFIPMVLWGGAEIGGNEPGSGMEENRLSHVRRKGGFSPFERVGGRGSRRGTNWVGLKVVTAWNEKVQEGSFFFDMENLCLRFLDQWCSGEGPLKRRATSQLVHKCSQKEVGSEGWGRKNCKEALSNKVVRERVGTMGKVTRSQKKKRGSGGPFRRTQIHNQGS